MCGYTKDPGAKGQASFGKGKMRPGFRRLGSWDHSTAALCFLLGCLACKTRCICSVHLAGNKATDRARVSNVTALLPGESCRSTIPGNILVDLAQPVRVRGRGLMIRNRFIIGIPGEGTWNPEAVKTTSVLPSLAACREGLLLKSTWSAVDCTAKCILSGSA